MGNSVYTVAQVNRYIKNMFDQDYALRRISVKGEISNCKYHSSGHIYFTLKDAGGTLKAVMFRSKAASLRVRLSDGMRVIASGSVTVYEQGGTYQLYAESIVSDGVGALAAAYEKLKNELEEMGMFAREYKQPIPKYALKVGVVTSPTGAAIRDICNITARRNPCVQLYLYPALVQGPEASASVSHGIEVLDRMGLDVLIVGRGGGSIEDLWAFNERETAEAIFNCSTPIISAVGHETDFTIADFVSDLRAPTPSAAAELAVFDYRALMDRLDQLESRFSECMFMQIDDRRAQLQDMERRLQILDPVRQTKEKIHQLDQINERLNHIMNMKLKDLSHHLSLSAGRLELLSPLKRISGGFAYVKDEEGKGILSSKMLHENQIIHLQFSDGEVKSKVLEIDSTAASMRNGE